MYRGKAKDYEKKCVTLTLPFKIQFDFFENGKNARQALWWKLN